MKKAFVVAAVLAFATAASAQYTVELDLNGVVGDGPDVVEAEVSDYIDVDVWMHGPAMVLSMGADICNYDGSLEFQGYTSNSPSGWTDNTVTANYPPCLTVQMTDFGFMAPVPLPYMMGTLTFHAAVDHSTDDLVVISGGWFSEGFGSGACDVLIGGTVIIGGSATEESSWGAVKGLFR